MDVINFTKISKVYESNSLVQKSAAKTLLSLLQILKDDNILDIGCGTGNLTSQIKALTNGKVVGIDLSPGMIEKAKEKNRDLDILFEIGDSEKLKYNDDFNVIFCNSTFQWFKNPETSIKNFYKALSKGGKIGIQAPATTQYCPNFAAAIEAIKEDRRTKDIFTHFKNPWFFLETAEAYANLFNKEGFNAIFSKIDTVVIKYSPEEVFRIFSSGAIAGYLNQASYSTPIDDNYISAFKEIVQTSIHNQVDSAGFVELVFNRIFLVAVKE